jgi:hypothetical protein
MKFRLWNRADVFLDQPAKEDIRTEQQTPAQMFQAQEIRLVREKENVYRAIAEGALEGYLLAAVVAVPVLLVAVFCLILRLVGAG